MLRLIYLLLRQRVHRVQTEAGVAHADRRAARWTAAVGAAALAAGAGAYALYGERHGPGGSEPARAQAPAALQLQVRELATGPLVVYLDALAADEPAGADAAPARAQIRSVNGAFEPAFQVAPVAARIDVSNDDPIPHNTHLFDGRRTLFNVALPLQGGQVNRVLHRTGVLEVRCDLHPWMRASIFVPPSRHYAVIREPGLVTLRDLPPGDYLVHAWSAGEGRRTQVITLRPGQTHTLEPAAR